MLLIKFLWLILSLKLGETGIKSLANGLEHLVNLTSLELNLFW